MMGFLERLRKKPAHVRTQYALGGAFVVTALIAIVWSTTLPTRFGEISGTLAEEGVEQTGALQNGFDALIQQTTESLTPPEEEIVEEAPVPTQFDTNAMNGLGGWGVDSNTATIEESQPTPTPQNVNEVPANPPAEAEATEPKEKVILIGTSTKKDE
jgi:hypothetical protein